MQKRVLLQSHNRGKNTTLPDHPFGCNLFTSNHLPFEQTIRGSVECRGIGLHSGAPVHVRILPAPAGRGIVFRRVDLEGFEIEATGRNVAKVSYATSLQKKGVLISTTEHLLSACIGIGLDNAIIELDNLELPILDGSAKPFVDLILQAGLKQQRKRRSYLKENVIVLTREGVKNGALRFEDEFVRHKTLDLIGDLALLGKQVIGRIVADRAGHAMHTALVQGLLKDRSLWEETTETAEAPATIQAATLSAQTI